MLTVHNVESIRRSAAMAPLSSDEAFRVFQPCDQWLRERARIAAVLAELPASWTAVTADDPDAAVALAKDCPILAVGGTG